MKTSTKPHLRNGSRLPALAILLFNILNVDAQEAWMSEALDTPLLQWERHSFIDVDWGYGSADAFVSDLSVASHDGVDGLYLRATANGYTWYDNQTNSWIVRPAVASATARCMTAVPAPSVASFWYRSIGGNGPGRVSVSFNGTELTVAWEWTKAYCDIHSSNSLTDFYVWAYSEGGQVGPCEIELSVDQFTIEPMPALSISDASVAEGDGGTIPLVFNVSLSHAVSFDISADVAVTSLIGNPVVNLDYLAPANRIVIPAGVIQADLVIPVIGDTVSEGDEQVLVRLSNPLHTILTDPDAVGTIIDDDSHTPQLGIQRVGNSVQLTWDTESGWTYTLQSASTLMSPVDWVEVQPHVNQPGNGGTASADFATTSPCRFFRIMATKTEP